MGENCCRSQEAECCGSQKGCGCGRNFMTKEEKIAELKEYQRELELEVKGVTEKIKELEKK